MNHTTTLRSLTACAMLCSTAAMAHITLPAGGAAAGSDYDAAFRVGHACTDAKATTGVRVQLPQGFTLIQAQPRQGWTLAAAPAEVLEGRLGASRLAGRRTGRVHRPRQAHRQARPALLQGAAERDVGNADWAQLPAAGSNAKLDLPAPRLDVLPAGVAAVEVRDAWVRQTVPGQSGTGAFMKLTAPSGARLVGAPPRPRPAWPRCTR